jgi:hypothetical protein
LGCSQAKLGVHTRELYCGWAPHLCIDDAAVQQQPQADQDQQRHGLQAMEQGGWRGQMPLRVATVPRAWEHF